MVYLDSIELTFNIVYKEWYGGMNGIAENEKVYLVNVSKTQQILSRTCLTFNASVNVKFLWGCIIYVWRG